MPETLFVADLHLSDDTPELNRLFLRFLEDKQGKADALYILGDLFEVWLGDDTADSIAHTVARALHRFSETAPVYFVCGNRDFMLGRDYAHAAGMALLPEFSEISLYGCRYLIGHGDTMCTDDTAYQRFRRIIRNPVVRFILRHLPRRRRERIAAALRGASKRKKAATGRTPVSDVTEAGVQAVLRRHPDITALIHGHTHRPAEHSHRYQNRDYRRYVLQDWEQGHGGYLSVSPEGIRAVPISE